MAPESTDYRDVSALAVTAGDVVAALEANRRRGVGTVLRVMPPFNGRMRARLHRVDAGIGGDADGPAPLHVDPAALVEDVPEYPTPDDTADRLRAATDTAYSIEAHRERHAAAVERWRATVAGRIVDAVELDGPRGTHRVAVTALG
ncbi:hypothetical protein BRC90_08810 [Halobacteriales archaeon QS_4_69_34]|nr:MAG: hypothetical protein BRC90_08810 [Halobacteriales archaeon QS_4_69_34]